MKPDVSPGLNPEMNFAITTRNTALMRGRIIDVGHTLRRGRRVREIVVDLTPEGASRRRTMRLAVCADVRPAAKSHDVASPMTPHPGDVVVVAARRSRRPWGVSDLRVISLRACETPSPCAASA